MTINPPLMNIPIGFSFREAINLDEPCVKQIIFAALKEHGLEPKPDSTDKDLSDIEGTYKNGYFAVVENENKIVATFALFPLDEQAVEIRKMYASPHVRGIGLGKWMVQYLLQIAKENGYKEVELETASSLSAAIHLYEKIGFVEKPFEHKTPRCDKAYHLKL